MLFCSKKGADCGGYFARYGLRIKGLMAFFKERLFITGGYDMKKQSKRGRKKNTWFTLKTGDSFVQLLPANAAAMAGVSIKTVYHWIAGSKTPRPQTLQLLEIRAGGLFPWKGWEGWRMDTPTGRLIAPNGYSFNSGELAWWSLEKALRVEMQRENAALRIQLETIRQEQHQAAINHNLIRFPRAKKTATNDG
jgi:hypothetical protein